MSFLFEAIQNGLSLQDIVFTYFKQEQHIELFLHTLPSYRTFLNNNVDIAIVKKYARVNCRFFAFLCPKVNSGIDIAVLLFEYVNRKSWSIFKVKLHGSKVKRISSRQQHVFSAFACVSIQFNSFDCPAMIEQNQFERHLIFSSSFRKHTYYSFIFDSHTSIRKS